MSCEKQNVYGREQSTMNGQERTMVHQRKAANQVRIQENVRPLVKEDDHESYEMAIRSKENSPENPVTVATFLTDSIPHIPDNGAVVI